MYNSKYKQGERKVMVSKRFNFTFSERIARILKKIPTGQRSKYLESLIYEDNQRNDLVKFIEKYKKRKKPIWTDENHPDLITDEDFANYRPLRWRMDLK